MLWVIAQEKITGFKSCCNNQFGSTHPSVRFRRHFRHLEYFNNREAIILDNDKNLYFFEDNKF